ncbi:MAG: flagellar protein FlgN [Firmicutes bacterium]|nr:flagellar protein FlgN [Bacillota bacterium]
MVELRELAEVLKKELDIYKDILTLSERKTDIIASGDIKGLDEIVKSEESLILNIGKLEDERYNILLNLQKTNGIDANKITLSELLEKLDPEQEYNLAEIQKQISDTLSRLEKVNERNALLIKKALEHINNSLELITSAWDKETGVYGLEKDAKTRKDVKSFLDYKV